MDSNPNLRFDTSATKWQVREVSARRDAVRALICRHPKRFLFGSDLVTRHGLPRDHYVSRYWCHRTLWESAWEGPSPIADPDYKPPAGVAATPQLRGLCLPPDVLEQVYHGNAMRLFNERRQAPKAMSDAAPAAMEEMVRQAIAYGSTRDKPLEEASPEAIADEKSRCRKGEA